MDGCHFSDISPISLTFINNTQACLFFGPSTSSSLQGMRNLPSVSQTTSFMSIFGAESSNKGGECYTNTQSACGNSYFGPLVL